jgi:hypothetical protein
VVAAAAAGGKIPPVVELSDSPVRQPTVIESATSKKPRGGAAASKKRSQPARKRKKPKPEVKDKLPPKGRKVIKRKATEVDG